MFSSILKTTFRNFKRYRNYTVINILGLTVGMLCCFMILLWVNDELQVDKFHEKDARIFQMKRLMHQDDGVIITTSAIPQPLEILLENNYEEVDKVAIHSWDMELLIQHKNDGYKELGKYASPELFDIFSFPFVVGDPETAMLDLNSIVVSKRLAQKLFGERWKSVAVGQLVKIDNETSFKVTGVFDDIVTNSSLQFEWVIPAKEFISRNDWVENWGNGGFRMVLTLKEGVDVNAFESKIKNEINNHTDDGNETVFVQKYSDQYLYGNFDNGVENGGRIDYVFMLFLVALIVIVVAGINFVNLATSNAVNRAREIGVRKVLGAAKIGLKAQFLFETLITTLGSTFLALAILHYLLPFFNQLTGKFIVIDYLDAQFWLITIGIALVTGIASGIYPAFFLSSFSPLKVISGQPLLPNRMSFVRKGLVVFQFTASILLIIGSIGINKQINFILNKNLGLDRENVVYLDLEGSARTSFESFSHQLLQHPNISHVASTNQNPLQIGHSTGSAQWKGKDPDLQVEISVLSVDFNFIETLKLELISGTNFTGNFYQDSVSYIINEEAARIMGMKDAVGQDLSLWETEGNIIGLVRDFHMASLHEQIGPLIIRCNPNDVNLAFIRTTGDLQSALVGIENIAKSFNPQIPFSYTFLDEEFRQAYQSEIVIGTLSKYFTAIAIFIACLGLFGLSAHSAQQRTKEISIRKVMGASVLNLVILLSSSFGKLVLVAFFVAIPLAYLVINNWLQGFAYNTSISIEMFIVAAVFTLLLTAITVSFKAIHVATRNPADTLKDE